MEQGNHGTDEISMWHTVLVRTYLDYNFSNELMPVLCLRINQLYENLKLSDTCEPMMIAETVEQHGSKTDVCI